MSSDASIVKHKSRRYLWIDNLKLFACLLVVLGHLYMSMMAGGWIKEDNVLYCWPIQTVYTFHVPLFFVCSGFLYQVTAPNKWSIRTHLENVRKKAIALGVPYITFSIITLLLKNIFSTEVNNAATPFLKTLFIEPIAPYWYLYTLFLLFCLIPPAVGHKRKKLLISMFILTFFIKIIYVSWLSEILIPDLVAKVMANAIWFCMGMLITEVHIKKKKIIDELVGTILLLICVLSYFVYRIPNNSAVVQYLFASTFVTSITYYFQNGNHYKNDGLVSHSVKYFMPIYVLHTIAAAGVRTILLKIGISLGIFHFLIGLGVSIFIPIIIYTIAEKYWWLLFWFEPIKAMKQKKR